MWKNYYRLIESKLDSLISKYRNDPEALAYLASKKLELEMFRRYSEYYRYVFYVLRASF